LGSLIEGFVFDIAVLVSPLAVDSDKSREFTMAPSLAQLVDGGKLHGPGGFVRTTADAFEDLEALPFRLLAVSNLLR